MKIGCWGFYGAENIGDDLILCELLRRVYKARPDAEVVVFSRSAQIQHPIPEGMRVTTVPHSPKELLRASLALDVLICGPGGLFPNRGTAKLLFWNILNSIMQMRRKKVLFFGIGIGVANFKSGIDRLLIRNLAKYATVFLCRQQHVADMIRLGQRAKHAGKHDGVDLIFAVQPADGPNNEEKTLGIALANIYGENYHDFLSEFAGTIQRVVGEEWNIKLLTFSKRTDGPMNAELKSLLPERKITILPYYENPYKMLDDIAACDACVCMRFHAAVLSFLQGKPCALIAYSDKMDDLAERTGMQASLTRVCIDEHLYYEEILPFNPVEFEHQLKELISKRCLGETQISSVEEMKKQAKDSWMMLEKILKDV